MPVSQNHTVRFGPFELDTQCGELRKSGMRLKLQGQPIQILEMLLAKPGELVTREEIQQRLWPADTFVDFDHSLNTAVKKLRQALGDEADAPRYIDTLPKRGYRFVGEVERVTPREENPLPADAMAAPTEPVVTPSPAGRNRRNWILAVSLVTLFIAGWLIYIASRPPLLPRITGSHIVAANLYTTLPVPDTKLLTDGTSIYFPIVQGATSSTFQVPMAGGEVSEIPGAHDPPYDISRDGSKWLLMAPDDPAWEHVSVLSKLLPAGTARLILKDGRYPIWASDGRGIFFVSNDYKELDRVNADGTGVQRIATSTDIGSPHLSPDGSRIRFSVGNDGELWEVSADGSNLHPVLVGQRHALGGVWSPDGKVYFFSGWDGERFSLWTAPDRLSWWQRGPAVAQPLTLGPSSYGRPIIGRDGKQLFAMGEEHQGELSVYDRKSEKFVPYMGGIAACYVDFSRDGQWMTYVSYPEGSLWRSRIDGSEKRQLISQTLGGFPRWSPDGKLIVFVASRSEKHKAGDLNGVYVVSNDGGAPNLLLAGDERAGDPTWSPDGMSIAYASNPDGIQHELRILNTQTMKSSKVSGSEGLFSPRWSPDGKYLAALSLKSDRILLFTVATQIWQELASGTGFGWESWSGDSRFVYTMAGDSLIRIEISSRKPEKVASVAGLQSIATGQDMWGYGWFGLSPDDRPVTTRDTGVKAIYAFDLEYK